MPHHSHQTTLILWCLHCADETTYFHKESNPFQRAQSWRRLAGWALGQLGRHQVDQVDNASEAEVEGGEGGEGGEAG